MTPVGSMKVNGWLINVMVTVLSYIKVVTHIKVDLIMESLMEKEYRLYLTDLFTRVTSRTGQKKDRVVLRRVEKKYMTVSG